MIILVVQTGCETLENTYMRMGVFYQEVTQTEMFLSEYTNRMKCQYVQHWRTRCSLTSKLQLYVDFNHDYNVAKYVLAVDIFK